MARRRLAIAVEQLAERAAPIDPGLQPALERAPEWNERVVTRLAITVRVGIA